MADETEAGKGRATRSRKEAEAARKQQMKTSMSRKDLAKRDRAAREEIRLKQRDALKSGDERYLPKREQGPVRRFTRDFVDRRFNFAEYLLIFLVVILVVGLVSQGAQWGSAATFFLYPFVIVGTILDEIVMVRGLRKELKARFGGDSVKGATGYAVLRSTQLRRFRLPKPQIKRGQELHATYR